MIQKNHGHRPDNRAPMHSNPHEGTQKQCGCGSDCKCGCQEGCPCTCSSAASGIASGVFGLISACLICGSIIYAAGEVKRAMPIIPRPQVHKAAALDSAAVNKIIETYIKENPKAIMSSLDAYERQQAKQRQPKALEPAMLSEIINDKTNHVLGNPKGSFVMIEFFDYNCGYCKMMNKKMAEAVKKSDNIRWILMDAPIFGERSEIIARYAYAAAKQGKFAEYHAALGEADKKDEAALKEIGKKLKLDVAKLEKDANSDAAKDKLAKTRSYTQKLGLGGVPMFVIDGQIQTGAFSDEKMDEYIKKANEMKKAKK